MNTHKLAGRSLSVLLSFALFASCQSGSGPSTLPVAAPTPAAPSSAAQPGTPLELPGSGFVCEPLKITLTTPPKLHLQASGSQAMITLPECDSVAYVRLQVTGVGIEEPIYAQGADEDGFLAVEAVCTMDLLLPEIPDGNGRILSFEAFDSSMQTLDALTYEAVFDLNSDDLEIDLNCLTTATAKVYDATLELSEVVASHLDLTDLQSFVGEVLGVGAEPYLFDVDPAFLNAPALAADLVSVNGDLTQLDPANVAYLLDVGLLQGTFAGLVHEDTLRLQLDDSANTELHDLGNGLWLMPNIEPGDYTLTVSVESGNGTTYQLPDPIAVQIEAQGQHDLGTLSVIPATPVISSLSVDPAQVGELLDIQGTGFHSSLAGNGVTLDGEALEIVSASNTVLTVRVPRNPGPGHQLQVTVGSQSSELAELEISRLRWEVDADNMLFTVPAIGPDGTLYISTSTGKVQAIDPDDGSTLWSHEGLDAVYTSPVLSSSGTVYALSKSGQLVALQASDGSLVYQSTFNLVTYSSPAVDQSDNIYFVSEDNEVISVDSAGYERWRFEGDALTVSNTLLISPSPSLGDNELVLYTGSLDGKVYALNASTGTKIWDYDTEYPIYSAPTLSQDGKLYVTNFAGHVLRLNAADGQLDWQQDLNQQIIGSPTLDNAGYLYFGSWTNKAYYMSTDGAKLGLLHAFGGAVDSAPLLDADGRIYLGDATGLLVALDAESHEIDWQYQLPNDVTASMAMDANGILYITSTNPGKIIALYSDALSLMNSDWPKHRHDLGNTGSLGVLSPPDS